MVSSSVPLSLLNCRTASRRLPLSRPPSANVFGVMVAGTQRASSGSRCKGLHRRGRRSIHDFAKNLNQDILNLPHSCSCLRVRGFAGDKKLPQSRQDAMRQTKKETQYRQGALTREFFTPFS